MSRIIFRESATPPTGIASGQMFLFSDADGDLSWTDDNNRVVTISKVDSGAGTTTFTIPSGGGTAAALEGAQTFTGQKTFNEDIVMANGKGISFAATGQAAGMTSETLTDYEEGTWTPNLTRVTTGFTLTQTRSGRYIKIGSVVVLWGTINITAVSAQGSNFWALDGLPFALGTERGVVGSAGNLYLTTAITTSTVMMHIIASTAGNYFVFRNTTGAYINENAQAGTLGFSIIYNTTT